MIDISRYNSFMTIQYFSNMSVEEFFSLNRGKIPAEVEHFFDIFMQRLADAESTVEEQHKVIERIEEQVFFAQELVNVLDKFAETLSKPKQKLYNTIRENTQFET